MPKKAKRGRNMKRHNHRKKAQGIGVRTRGKADKMPRKEGTNARKKNGRNNEVKTRSYKE
eukprot:5363363-Karenia_brevis.AAC.1